MTRIVRKKSAVQKTLLEDVRNNITVLKDSSAKTRALGICDKAISICTKLSKIVVTEECGCLQKQGLAQEIENLHVLYKRRPCMQQATKDPIIFPETTRAIPSSKCKCTANPQRDMRRAKMS